MTRLEILADIGKTKAEIQKLQEHLADIEKSVEQEEAPTRFEPKIKEEYKYVGADGFIYWDAYTNSSLHEMRFEFNNCFRETSSENLGKYSHNVLRVQNRLMQLHEELCPEFESKWDGEHYTAIIMFNIEANKWDFQCVLYNNCHIVGFNCDAAKKACEILNAERFMMDKG